MISRRTIFYFLFFIVMSGSFSACVTNPNTNSILSSDNHFMSIANTTHLKQYSITGQVVDQQGSPVFQCRVYLTKRTLNPASNREDNIKILKQNLIVNTDSEGQYYLTFEPGKSNDLWLTFMDSEGLYDPKSVRLNEKMGDSLFEYPGTNPIYINIVLER